MNWNCLKDCNTPWAIRLAFSLQPFLFDTQSVICLIWLSDCAGSKFMWESLLGHSKHRQTWWKRDGFGWQYFFWVSNLSDSFLSIIIFILGAGGEDWHDNVLWMQSDECNFRLCYNVHSHQRENKNNFLAGIVKIKASFF